LYSQDGQGYKAVVHAHYFIGNNDWLVTEYDATDDLAFGWACLQGDRQNAELGYWSMAELDAVAAPLRLQNVAGSEVTFPGVLHVERETDWPEGLTLAEAIAELDRRAGR